MASVREEYDNILSLRRMWLVIRLKKEDARQVVLHLRIGVMVFQ